MKTKFSEQEIEDWLHTLSIDQIGRVKSLADQYLSKYFGFSQAVRESRTKDWVKKASKRLKGQKSVCCECANEYPLVDHHFDGHVYCKACRKEQG